MKGQKSRRLFVLAILAMAAIFAFGPGCDEAPVYQGEGGIFDSPISTVAYGEYCYVTNANFDLSGDKDGWIAVVDIAVALQNRKEAVVNRVFTDPYLGEMIITQDGSTAYVADRKIDSVLILDMSDPFEPEVIDLDPDKNGDQGIEVGLEPMGLALSPDESLLFVANVGSGDVSIVDTQSRVVIKNEKLSSGINSLAVDPAGEYVYVTNKSINAVSLLEVETGEFVASFAVGDTRSGLPQDTRGLVFSEDGRFAYIAAGNPPALMVVDTDKLPYYPDRAVVEFIPMDSQPSAVKLTPDGKEIWVANYLSSRIYVIDASTHTIIDVVDGGVGPYSITFTENPEVPGHYYAFVVNFFGHNIFLIDAKTKDVIWAIP